MATHSQFLPQIEKEIAQLLIRKTYDQEIDENHCSKIAKQILELFPEKIDLENLRQNLLKLKEIYFELNPIGIKYLEILTRKEGDEQLQKVRQKINHILYGSKIRN